MEPIQYELNALNEETKKALLVLDEIKERVTKVKPKLVPLAEMKAGVCNTDSKNKYFPQFLGRFDDKAKTKAFYEYVNNELK